MLLSEQVNFRKITIKKKRKQMNKIRNMLLAAIAIVGLSTSAWAGTANIGVVMSMIEVDASGTETDRLTAAGANVADTSVRTKDINEDAFTGSIFAEYTTDTAWALTAGVEVTPGKADLTGNFSRSDTELSKTGNVATTNVGTLRTVEAAATGFGTVYIEAPIWGPLYVRAGASRMTIDYKTTSSANGGTYTDNINLNGTNIGVGLKGSRDGFVYKLAYEDTSYGDFSLRSTGNSVAANSNGVTGNVDTSAIRLSVAKSF